MSQPLHNARVRQREPGRALHKKDRPMRLPLSNLLLALIASASWSALGQTCMPTPITPYVNLNGTWTQTASATLKTGDSAIFGPQPASGGTWSWNGCGTAGSAREQTIRPSADCTATATYTNACGAQSAQTFSVKVGTQSCGTTGITPYVNVNGSWTQTASATIKSGDSVILGPQPASGGMWSWTGCGTAGSSREQTIRPTSACTATATYTNACGAQTQQAFSIKVAAGDFAINWTDVHQTMDGFGASDAWHGALTDAQADLYFSTTSGIGLSLLRMGINPDGGTFSTWSNAKLAIARGAKVWAAPWSPPANLKTTANLNSGSLRSDSYSTWAATLASFVTKFNANVGSQLYAISAQNEPDFDTKGAYDMCLYSFPEMATFVDQLGAAIGALNLPSPPKIIAPESASWGNLWSYSSAINANPAARGYIGIYATHQYGGVSTYQALDKPLWETEQSSFEAFDPSIANALKVGGWINEALTSGNVSAWHYWWLNGLNSDNEGLTGKSGDFQLTKRLFALGNYSRFVRPGWVRISVDGNVPGLLVTAFKNPVSGDFAIVVANSGAATTRTFSIAGADGSAISAYVTADTALGPIGTDGNLSLGSVSKQVPASIPIAQGRFTAPIAYGLTTFIGKAN